MEIHESRETITSVVDALVAALSERGLAAETVDDVTVRAANRAADPPPGVYGLAWPGPGLWQTVACRPDEGGRIAWWWVWAGATRDASPEYELLGPANDVRAAADRIARVLRLRDDTAEAAVDAPGPTVPQAAGATAAGPADTAGRGTAEAGG